MKFEKGKEKHLTSIAIFSMGTKSNMFTTVLRSLHKTIAMQLETIILRN